MLGWVGPGKWVRNRKREKERVRERKWKYQESDIDWESDWGGKTFIFVPIHIWKKRWSEKQIVGEIEREGVTNKKKDW